jgi:hypothetical protein
MDRSQGQHPSQDYIGMSYINLWVFEGTETQKIIILVYNYFE